MCAAACRGRVGNLKDRAFLKEGLNKFHLTISA
jgi:hypothetical protein